MKRNLFLISYDYNYCVKVARLLADFFELRHLDWRELFEFDNVPNTLEDVIKANGAEYVREKLHSVCKMECDFDDAVFSCDLAATKGIDGVINKIKENNFIIFLKKDDVSAQVNLKQKYDNSEMNSFFGNSMETINAWGNEISKNADVIVDIDGLTQEETKNIIIEKLRDFIK